MRRWLVIVLLASVVQPLSGQSAASPEEAAAYRDGMAPLIFWGSPFAGYEPDDLVTAGFDAGLRIWESEATPKSVTLRLNRGDSLAVPPPSVFSALSTRWPVTAAIDTMPFNRGLDYLRIVLHGYQLSPDGTAMIEGSASCEAFLCGLAWRAFLRPDSSSRYGWRLISSKVLGRS